MHSHTWKMCGGGGGGGGIAMYIYSLHIKVSQESYDDTYESDDSQLVSSANEAGEEDGVGGRTEDITMDLLPAIFISQISLMRWEDTALGTQTDRQTGTHTHKQTDRQTDRHTHQVIEFLLSAVSGVVLTQCSHEDHAHQTHEKYHHHEGVEYREPADLETGCRG